MKIIFRTIYLDFSNLSSLSFRENLPATIHIGNRYIPWQKFDVIVNSCMRYKDRQIVSDYFSALNGSLKKKEQLIDPPALNFIVRRGK